MSHTLEIKSRKVVSCFLFGKYEDGLFFTGLFPDTDYVDSVYFATTMESISYQIKENHRDLNVREETDV